MLDRVGGTKYTIPIPFIPQICIVLVEFWVCYKGNSVIPQEEEDRWNQGVVSLLLCNVIEDLKL
jgi:hypothetical protein